MTRRNCANSDRGNTRGSRNSSGEGLIASVPWLAGVDYWDIKVLHRGNGRRSMPHSVWGYCAYKGRLVVFAVDQSSGLPWDGNATLPRAPPTARRREPSILVR